MRQLLERSNSLNVTCIKVYLISRLIVQSWSVFSIIIPHHIIFRLSQCSFCLVQYLLHLVFEFMNSFQM
jgi:hypothetical protein